MSVLVSECATGLDKRFSRLEYSDKIYPEVNDQASNPSGEGFPKFSRSALAIIKSFDCHMHMNGNYSLAAITFGSHGSKLGEKCTTE